MKTIKIAYIGGGSRLWARGLMSDLAMEADLGGEVYLYDIDIKAAENNAIIGQKMMALDDAKSAFTYKVAYDLEQALTGADFVFISILPATFEEMSSYVHIPEKWGIYQTVGDTTGPAGIFRSLIMMPVYETFALAIKKHAPNAWVINFTNPMTLCVQMLYHAYPNIKAFGNCHEIFHVQDILKRALREETGIEAKRSEIKINPIGINHFTWINYATYKDIDVMPIYARFAEKYHDVGLSGDDWIHVGPFGSAERVKLDLFRKYNVIAAAGDRHLVEFLPHDWYTKNIEMIKSWRFFLTPVGLRKEIKEKGNQQAIDIINGIETVKISGTGEEGIHQMKALLGFDELITNVNMPNLGQIPNLPLGHVVETNALFRKDDVRPIWSGNMPQEPLYLTLPHIKTHQLLLKAFDTKNLSYALEALNNDVLVSHLSNQDKKEMFNEIVEAIKPYLTFYDK
jgi:galacturan 1,4-alpha-galacturonidase